MDLNNQIINKKQLLEAKIRYTKNMLHNASIEYNNLIEFKNSIFPYELDCLKMEIDLWYNQLTIMKNELRTYYTK